MSIPVLAWGAYGSVKVMRAETPAHFDQIVSEISNAMQGWGEDENIESLRTRVLSAPNEKAAAKLLDEFMRPHRGDTDAFDSFEFTVLKD
jgi:hypothetical protein